MTSYPRSYNIISLAATVCYNCGRNISRGKYKGTYCSKQCACAGEPRSLRDSNTTHTSILLEIKQEIEPRHQEGNPRLRSQFSKPLPRVLTIWRDEEPPAPPPKSARHLPQSFRHQQTELPLVIPPVPSQPLEHGRRHEIAPTPPLKSTSSRDLPRLYKKQKSTRVAKQLHLATYNRKEPFIVSNGVVPTHIPPVQPTPGTFESLTVSTRTRCHELDQPASSRSSGTSRRIYALPLVHTRTSRSANVCCTASVPTARQVSLSSASSPHHDGSARPGSRHYHLGRRIPVQSRILGEDIPILVPEFNHTD